MKKSKSSEETLKAIRRNTAYTNSRTLSLIYCVLLVGVIGLLVFISTQNGADKMPSIEIIAWMFGGVLAGVAASACLYHYLFAHYDQADALLQVAKFQERSIRTRKDAVDLVEKIREEVSKDEGEAPDLIEDEPPIDEIAGDPQSAAIEENVPGSSAPPPPPVGGKSETDGD
jgi:hypothetical protein